MMISEIRINRLEMMRMPMMIGIKNERGKEKEKGQICIVVNIIQRNGKTPILLFKRPGSKNK